MKSKGVAMSQKQEDINWVVRSEVTHEQDVSLTHDVPTTEVLKKILENTKPLKEDKED